MVDERYRRTPRSMDVGFVFGALGADELAGTVLVRMLAPLGLGESATRNLLTRMVARGSLEVRRSGRLAGYRLSPGVLSRYREIEGTDVVAPWSGRFHAIVYDIGERHRSLRDRFRYLYAYAGYGVLRSGLLIAPVDRRDRVGSQLPELPRGCVAFACDVVPTDPAEARRMAATAWDLDDVSRRYREAAALLAQSQHRSFDDPWAGLAELRSLYQQLYGVQLADPRLPPELLPTDWPAAHFGDLREELNRAWGPQLQPRLRAEARGLDPAGLCRFYDSPWTSGGGRVDP